MFKKKKLPAKTVSEAIAPFREVQDNLGEVMNAALARRNTGNDRIADAEKYLRQVKADETAAITDAVRELKQAEKIAAALSTLLGEQSPTGPAE